MTSSITAPLKTYNVAIEPRYPSSGLRNSTSQYTAASRGDAIKQARRDVRNAGHSRLDGPLAYRARLAD